MTIPTDRWQPGARVRLKSNPGITGVVRYNWTGDITRQRYAFVEWDDMWHYEGWDIATSVRKRSATSMDPDDLEEVNDQGLD